MSRLMNKEGYWRTWAYNRKWGKKLDKVYKAMESFMYKFYLEGGTLPEATHALHEEVNRAAGNARVHFLARDGEHQKKLRRKRLAARRSKR